MEINIKEISKEIHIEPDLLKFKQVEERLDVKPKTKINKIRITWTDQHDTERNIRKLTDGHAANLASWLRERGLTKSEKIIQAELQRRCTGSYPDEFGQLIEDYKSRPEIWRMKVY
jgi:hypothetical protein